MPSLSSTAWAKESADQQAEEVSASEEGTSGGEGLSDSEGNASVGEDDPDRNAEAESSDAEEGAAEEEGSSLTDAAEVVVYYEVTFRLPDSIPEEETDQIVMEETAMVPEGTLIGELEQPEWSGYLFLNWYYDAELQELADNAEPIDKDVTLYPQFAIKEGMEDHFRNNYISAEDVDPDFAVIIRGQDLSPEELAELITVRDMELNEALPFTLVEIEDPTKFELDPEEFDLEEDVFQAVSEAVSLYQEEELNAEELLAVLRIYELSDEAVEKIMTALAPDEWEELKEQEDLTLVAELVPEELRPEDPDSPEETASEDQADASEEKELPEVISLTADAEEETEEDSEAADFILTEEEEAVYDEIDQIYEELSEQGIDREDVTEEDFRTALGLTEEDTLEGYYLQEMGLTYDALLRVKDQLGFWEEELEYEGYTWYQVLPEDGNWTEGTLFQVELGDTEKVRFLDEEEVTEEEVIYYNFSVYKAPVNRIRLNSSVIFLSAGEVDGVELGGGLYSVSVSEEEGNTAEQNLTTGVLTYEGQTLLEEGDLVAVYDGVLLENNTVEGEVGYFKIAAVLEDHHYSYTTPDLMEVIFTPDNIPVEDDGTLDDGVIVIAREYLDFSDPAYAELGLDENTVAEEGDYLSFYAASEDEEAADLGTPVAYGCITAVEDQGDSVILYYDPATLEELENAVDMYTASENLEIPFTDEEISEISRQAEIQMTESGFAEQAGNYMAALIFSDEEALQESGCEDALTSASFEAEDGTEMTLDQVRLLASGGGSVTIKADNPTFSITRNLVHFKNKGSGARITATAGFTITINLNQVGNKQNQLVIKGTVKGEQEILLDTSAKAKSVWTSHKVYIGKWFGKKRYLTYYTLDDIQVSLTLKVGTYTGLGFTAIVKTSSEPLNKNTSWGEIVSDQAAGLDLGDKTDQLISSSAKILETVEKIKKNSQNKQGSDSTVTGSLPDKYSSFLKTSSSRITLLSQRIFEVSAGVDPLHLINVSLYGDFVITLNAKAMLGFGISFATAKQYTFTLQAKTKSVTSTEADIEQPNFLLNFYLFGMIDVRAGIRLDARVGFISTKLASVGIQGEIGVYMKLYGFLFITYTWSQKKGGKTTVDGSLLFEIGLYLTISFYAQAGDGRVDYSKQLYSKEWPLVTLGAESHPIGFVIAEDDSRLTIEMGSNTQAQVFGDLFKINSMSLRTGSVAAASADSNKRGSAAYTFTVNGQTYTQYNEQNFYVESHDLTGKNGKATNNHSFIYLPESNTIVVKPAADFDQSELWGEITFTYRNSSFGLTTNVIKRTITVHWVPVKSVTTIRYFTEQEDGTYQLTASEEKTAYNKTEYNLQISDALISRYDGYVLDHIDAEHKGKKSALSVKSGSVDKIAVDGSATVISCYYRLVRYQVTWELMTPGDDTAVSASAASTETPGTKVENCVPSAVLDSVSEDAGYHVEWFAYAEEKEIRSGNHSLVLAQQTRISTIPQQDVTIRGIYVKNEFTATWMDGDTEIESRAVTYQHLLTAPAVSKEGYILEGWKLGDEMLTSETAMPSKDITLQAVWKKDRYAVSFELDGQVLQTSEAPFDSLLSQIAPKETKEGYTVTWKQIRKEDGSTEEFTENSRLNAANMTVIGEWEPNLHTVSWIIDQTCVWQEEVAYGSALTLPEIEAKEGYQLSDWGIGLSAIVDDGTEPEKLTADFTMPDEDVILGASWNVNEHEVNWISDGEVIRTETAEYAQTLTAPLPEEKEGYTFAGWSLDGETVSEEIVMPDQDLEITALWTVNVHKVTWIMGSTILKEETVAYGSSLTPPANAEAEGYSRGSWTVDGDTLLDYTMPDHDIIVTADLTPVNYHVTWISDGKTVSTATTAYGQTIVPPTVSKTGYTLTGWTVNGELLSENALMPARDITAEAVWAVQSYQVNWVVGTELVKTENLPYGSLLTRPEVTKEHYTLSDWTLNGEVLAADATVPASAITITAQWVSNTHKVTWMNGDTSYAVKWVKYGEYIPSVSGVTAPTGYRFTGWYLNGAIVSDSMTMPDEDLVLTAGFEPRTYTVFWFVDGTYTQQSVAYGSALTPPALSKTGYTLSNWSMNGTPLSDSFTMPAENILLSAAWIVNKHTVTWVVDGSVYKTETADYGSLLSCEAPAARTGYDFSGWMIGTLGVTGSTVMPDQDLTITGTFVHNTHIWDSGEITVKPTCDSEGVKVYTCTICGESYGEIIAADPDNHVNFVTLNKEDATCRKDGYTGDLFCADCLALITEGSNIPRTGEHAWDKGSVTAKADCLHEGTVTYTCTVCGETKEEQTAVDPKNHVNTSVINKSDATCLKNGYTGDTYCTDCGQLISKGSVIKAAGSHTWSSTTETVAATAVKAGSITYTCSVCGAKKTEVIQVEPRLEAFDGTDGLLLSQLTQIAEAEGALKLSDLDPERLFTAYIGTKADAQDRVNITAQLTWGAGADQEISSLKAGDTVTVHITPDDETVKETDLIVTLK